MQRFNLTIFKQFWTIAKSYWPSDEKWRAGGLLLVVIVLSLGYTGVSVVLNNKRGALISALSAQDEVRFWQTILVFAGTLVVYAPLYAGYDYLRDRLGLEWRRWLTQDFTDRYFQNRAFYSLNHVNADIDNPDQRITEDIKSFTQESLTLLLAVVDSLQILIQVNLPNLEESHGGFSAEQNWSEILSLREQQRLIFARLLLNKPNYAVLDEATSALDSKNEAHLYQQLQDSRVTYLSVGYRKDLCNYHQSILDFTANQTWSLKASEA